MESNINLAYSDIEVPA